MAPGGGVVAAGGPTTSLKQKIKQKFLKPKYTPHHDDEEALHLCPATAQRSGSADIVLDAASVSPASSRPHSVEPYHDITASLLGAAPQQDAAATGSATTKGGKKSDQGLFKRNRFSSTSMTTSATPNNGSAGVSHFKGCLPFANKHPAAGSSGSASACAAAPNNGLPTAFNHRQSILGRLSSAARKSPLLPGAADTPTTAVKQPKAKPAPKATPVKTKKVAHPLHMAAWRTNVNELQEQLNKPGADANKRDKNSMTPLHYAAWQGSIDCVQLLLEHKADINRPDAEGMLPIHFAAMFNRLDVAKMLLDRGSLLQPPPAKKGRLQVCWPTTPLIVAAKMGHTDMVALLMDRGAGIAGVSKSSKSALHEAALCGHADVVAEMTRRESVDANTPLAKNGYTALHLAALKGSQPVVQVLLLGRADVDARAKDGRTPLHLACEHGNMEAAAALIGLGGADLGARDASGSTPLHIAVDKNHLQLAKSLMDRGAALDTTTNLGALPLNYAHDPDFYKLLRAVRWYSTASCPSGNNPSSSSYWSPPGAMEAAGTAAATATAAVRAAEPASTTALPVNYFANPEYLVSPEALGGASSSSTDAAAAAAEAATGPEVVAGYCQAASPTQGLIEIVPASAAPAAPSAAVGAGAGSSRSRGGALFDCFTPQGGVKPSGGNKAGGGFPASSWLKALHLPGATKQKGPGAAGPLAATMALASGGLAPVSAGVDGVGSSAVPVLLPTSTSAGGFDAGYSPPGPAGSHHSRSSSRSSSSLSLSNAAAANNSSASKRSSHHTSPAASEGSSIVARRAAADIARKAVAAVVERAAREEAQEAFVAAAAAASAAHEHSSGSSSRVLQDSRTSPVALSQKSVTSSPETWSCTSSVSRRPTAGVTVSATSGITTQATLRRLLGFDDDTSNHNTPAAGDQDKWLPGTAATPSSAATFAAFAAEASAHDDVKAAAVLAATAPPSGASSSKGGSGGIGSGGVAVPAGAPKPSAAAAAAAFTAAAAAAAAAAVGVGQGYADAVKSGGSPSAQQGSAGKGKRNSFGKAALRPWRA